VKFPEYPGCDYEYIMRELDKCFILFFSIICLEFYVLFYFSGRSWDLFVPAMTKHSLTDIYDQYCQPSFLMACQCGLFVVALTLVFLQNGSFYYLINHWYVVMTLCSLSTLLVQLELLICVCISAKELLLKWSGYEHHN